jgi:heat shock protein HtpX
MVGALLALAALYVALGYAVALLFGLFVAQPGLGHLLGIALAVTLLAGSQYYYGADLALRVMDAHVVEREEYPDLHDRAQYLAQQADLPAPRMAIADNRTPNAFAAGPAQSDAVVCVTTGLLNELDDEELDGVLAHEIAHIANQDFRLMTLVTALSAMAGWIVRWGFYAGNGNDGGGQWQLLAGYAAAIAVWAGSVLVGRLLSRYREYAADRSAAQLTGNPTALASALVTISDALDETPEEDLRSAEQVNALLVSEVTETRLGKLFRTHPNVEDRVERLHDLAAEQH